jgi:hypothetical protein
MSKQTAAATREGERLHKRWRDKLKEDLHLTRIKNREAIARDHQEWRKTVLEVKVHNRLQQLMRFVIQTVVFNHHAILSPILCTIPVQPNFIHNTHP